MKHGAMREFRALRLHGCSAIALGRERARPLDRLHGARAPRPQGHKSPTANSRTIPSLIARRERPCVVRERRQDDAVLKTTYRAVLSPQPFLATGDRNAHHHRSSLFGRSATANRLGKWRTCQAGRDVSRRQPGTCPLADDQGQGGSRTSAPHD